MIEKIPSSPEPEEENKFIGFVSRGSYRTHLARQVSDPTYGPLAEVNTGRKKMRLMPDEWKRFQERRRLEPFDIMTVQPGDILELTDGRWLKITENLPAEQEVTFEVIESSQPTNQAGYLVTKPYDRWRLMQDEVIDYLPGKLTQQTWAQADENQPPVLESKSTPTPVAETQTPTPEPTSAVPETIPKPIPAPPPEPMPPLPTPDSELNPKLSAATTPEKPPAAPLSLTTGQTIWTKEGEAVKVVDVVAGKTTDHPALRDGYVVLGFNPKPGRNDTYQEEIVPFYKIERQRQEILLEPPVDPMLVNRVLQDALRAERKFTDEQANHRKKWWQFWK